MLHRVLWLPKIHLHQRDDGRIVLGEEDGPPPGDAHAAHLQGRPNEFPSREVALRHAERMLADARRYLPDLPQAGFESVVIGWRPMPLDGFPVIGSSPARPDVYLAVMHSGVTLAPVVGQLVAHEISEGVPAAGLSGFRPDRKFERSVGH
jgi:glycine/D-amino acid oxidase-like deaminating enzyme